MGRATVKRFRPIHPSIRPRLYERPDITVAVLEDYKMTFTSRKTLNLVLIVWAFALVVSIVTAQVEASTLTDFFFERCGATIVITYQRLDEY